MSFLMNFILLSWIFQETLLLDSNRSAWIKYTVPLIIRMLVWHFNVRNWFDWESITTFLWLEWNCRNYGHIFFAALISHFRQSKAKKINVRQFPTSSNFQIWIILSNLWEISFYFPPLEVVHPVWLCHCPNIYMLSGNRII